MYGNCMEVLYFYFKKYVCQNSVAPNLVSDYAYFFIY